jgi:hypothetical protein
MTFKPLTEVLAGVCDELKDKQPKESEHRAALAAWSHVLQGDAERTKGQAEQQDDERRQAPPGPSFA